MSVFLFATLDTKGQEAAFVRDRLRELGLDVFLVDTGCLGNPAVVPNVSREEVFSASGQDLEELQAAGDRGHAVTAAADGAALIAVQEYAVGRLEAVLALGGSAGTTIGTAAMRALPLGVPKLMVSTMASGQVRHYVGAKDILMLNSVVDVAGLNRVSRMVLDEAAAAMAGMVRFRREAVAGDGRPLVAATMFGVTTPCVEQARQVLEAAGCEVLVFHATGAGGQAMESLIAEGLIAGVLDITTTELADELVGGVLTAGPARLTAATRAGTPQVVSVGALDMVNFGPRDTVPDKFAARRFHQHNPTVTLMRTTVEENRALGTEIGGKLAPAGELATILLPRQGVSAIDRQGQPFDDPQARMALFQAIRENCGRVPCRELDVHINDPEFARQAAETLLELMKGRTPV